MDCGNCHSEHEEALRAVVRQDAAGFVFPVELGLPGQWSRNHHAGSNGKSALDGWREDSRDREGMPRWRALFPMIGPTRNYGA